MSDSFKKKMEEIDFFDDDDHEEDDREFIAIGFAAGESAKISTQQAAKNFEKPSQYTRHTRKLYENEAAKRQAKKELFSQGIPVDPYTGDELVLTQAQAKASYGDDWAKHAAEADHIKPLERIYAETADLPWLTTDDIRTAANSPDNLRVISRKVNNTKRKRTNEEFVKDNYREDEGIDFTEEGEQAALRDGDIADYSIRRQLERTSVENMLETSHQAGLAGAQNAGIMAGAMSAIRNMVAVIKGEKETEEAIADTVKDAGRATVAGYAMSGGLTAVSHSLSNSKSKFIQSLIKSNVPGKIITAVMTVGDTLKRYGNGEITTQQCLIELGERGLNLGTMGYSMAVGQALIPIPVIGGAIGALVGTALTSNYYHNLINTLQQKELEHQERLRIIAECREAAEQTKAFRMKLESYLKQYFREYQDCFDSAIKSMKFSFATGDANGVIAGANQITAKLGGRVDYETVDEFWDYFDSTEIDII